LHIKNKQKTRFKRLNFLKKKNFKKRIKRRRSKKSKLVKRINPKKLKIFFSTNKISRQVLEKYKARAAARQLKKTHKLHKGKNEKVVKPKIKTNLKHNSFLKKKFTYFNFKNNRVN
jgi:hypothetical protein